MPGEEITAVLITLPEDRPLIPGILQRKSPLLWRVYLRRGLEKLQNKDWEITCVIGVTFKNSDIEGGGFLPSLEKMPEYELHADLKNPHIEKHGAVRVAHDAQLPKHLRVGLGQSLKVGSILVRPLHVGLDPLGDLVMYLRLKNVSGVLDQLTFNPLPAEFAKYNRNNPDAPKPYTFLEAGKLRLYGASVEWFTGKIGEELPAADKELKPGKEMTVTLTTLPEDRGLIPQVLKEESPLLWRVQLRRGLDTGAKLGWVMSCVVGVEFKSSEIGKGEP
jgi:hypothetical protein